MSPYNYELCPIVLIATFKPLYLLFTTLCTSCLLGQPLDIVGRLSADAFSEREVAQSDLFKWAEENGDGAIHKLLGLLDTDEDPEIRERISQVLRRLSDETYQNGGKPYLGISMTEDMDPAEGKDVQRFGIVVTEILRGSPAASSELLAGDVIISINGEGWDKPGAMGSLSESIAKMEPGSVVILLVERADMEPFEINVRLRRCPVPRLMPGIDDLGSLELKAEEAFFKKWLAEKRKLN